MLLLLTGAYYIGLDHLRARRAPAFDDSIHARAVPFEYVPTLPAEIIDEGHCGVALFMCLSGYLFAKLLDGKRISYSGFLWNRFVRLAPLLGFVILIAGLALHRNGHAGILAIDSGRRHISDAAEWRLVDHGRSAFLHRIAVDPAVASAGMWDRLR